MTHHPDRLEDHFLRRESANLIAVLTRTFGFGSLDLVEDVVQDALLQAMQTWRQAGVPDKPAAWLHRVARNRMIDALRRGRRWQSPPDLEQLESSVAQDFEPDEIQDGLLGMIFACCHPSLERRSQLSLTLKMLCGLGDQEIARGLMTSPASVKRRVSRAKRTLQDEGASLQLPAPDQWASRLATAHEVLYLLFNEGYSASRGDLPVRIDLCEEACRLTHLLCANPIALPATRALLALMLYHAARLESRTGDNGAIVLMADQDRTKWDWKMIALAESWFERSAAGDEVSRFHLEAGIARLHCIAPTLAETDWASIVSHYDVLLRLFPSPLYTLNRAVALGQIGRIDEALLELTRIDQQSTLERYPLLHCALADLLLRSGARDAARLHLRQALLHTHVERERQLIQARIAETMP